MAMEGKTPREKVEGGTGFKVEKRFKTVYQRIVTGKASSRSKTGWRSRKRVLKAPPETPVTGETVKDPEKESVYAGEEALVRAIESSGDRRFMVMLASSWTKLFVDGQAFMMRIKPEKRTKVKASGTAMKAMEGAGAEMQRPHPSITKTMRA